MRGSAWSGPLIAACASLVLIGLCELGTNIWIAHRGDPLDHALRVIRADQALGWRQKADLDITFYGLPLHTNESGFRAAPLETFARRPGLKVLVLGPSSAFGWGVRDEETYAARLETILQGEPNHRQAAVFNAGQIGYSSWQGLKLFRAELRPLKPGVVLIAYGVNDADRHRFFFDSPDPDRIELAKGRNGWGIAAQNALARVSFFRVAVRGLHAAFGGLSSREVAVPGWRVSLDDLQENLRGLVRSVQDDGARAILLGTPFDREAFLQAPEPEAHRLADDLLDVNRALERVARDLSVECYDARSRLDLLNRSTEAFVDPIHPSAAGHAAIARELATLIQGRAPDR